MRELLKKCSDIHVRCSDGELVGANKFTLLSTCTVLYDMWSEFQNLDIIPMDTVSPATVRVAIDIIHGVKKIADLTIDETKVCLEGFDIFGCTILSKKLHARLWTLISRSTSKDEVFNFGERLLYTNAHARDYLNKVKTLCPNWKDFKELFQRVRLSESAALLCMWRLCRYFPAHLVFEEIMDSLPQNLLTLELCLKVWGAYRTGVYHHPDEIVMSTNKVLSKFPQCDHAYHLRTISDAFGRYETSPGSKLLATTLTFSNEPLTSVLLKIYEPFTGTRSLRIGKFLAVTVDTMNGRLGGTLDVLKLHMFEHYPTTLLLRVITFSSTSADRYDVIGHSYAIEEAWRRYPDVDRSLDLEEFTPPSPGVKNDDSAVRSALQSPETLRYVRLDFFYGHSDVRSTPIF